MQDQLFLSQYVICILQQTTMWSWPCDKLKLTWEICGCLADAIRHWSAFSGSTPKYYLEIVRADKISLNAR